MTALFTGVAATEPPTPVLFRLFWRGVGYGGGLRDRAASQSKGMEEIEGVDAGERYKPSETRLIGVEGRMGEPAGEEGRGLLGDAEVLLVALFVCARRRRAIVADRVQVRTSVQESYWPRDAHQHVQVEQ